ncbi:hypothetical protein ACS0TY_020705 [Phlomoides rotata]
MEAKTRQHKPHSFQIPGGAPKTSEYAYFKSMKCGAVCGRSCVQREENDQKNSKTNYLVRDPESVQHSGG